MTLPTLLRFSLRYYRRHRLLAALCLLGICLGVGIVVAVELINRSAFSSLASSVDFLSGKASHSVVSTYGRIDERFFLDIWTDPDVQAASPVIEVMATTLETADEPIRFLGLDPLLETEFRTLAPAGGRQEDLVRFLTSKVPSVLLSEKLLRRYGLKVGDSLTILTAGVEKRARIHGVLPAVEGISLGDNVGVLDIGAAQEVFGRVGYLDRIDIVVPGSADAFRDRLPVGLSLTDRTERKAALQAMLRSFQLNLTAMSLLALFVGVFLIYNFSMFAVLSRREELSLLLTLGSERKELLVAFLSESVVLAAVGSMLGIGFGFLVAWLSIGRVSSSISEIYFYVSAGAVRLTASTIFQGLGVGFLATFLGTALPALEVAATPPVLGMKRRTIEDRAQGVKGLLLVSGAVCAALALACVWASRVSVFWGFAAAFGITLAFALFTPSFLSFFAHYFGLWLRNFFRSLEGFLAARSIRASLSRTSIAVAALAVALAMTVGVDTMIHSFRESVKVWLESSLQGDLYVSPSTTKWAHPLPQQLVEQLTRDPRVTAMERYAAHQVKFDGRWVRLRVIDGAVLKEHVKFHFLAGDEHAWERLIAGGVFISETLGYRTGLKVGRSLVLNTPEGERTFPIVAVIREYSSDQGAILIDRGVHEKIWKDKRVQSVALFLKPGVSSDEVRQSITGAFPGLDRTISSNARMKKDILTIFDQTFAPTATLKGVSLLVALLGVATALMAILMERSREMTLMGYLGLTPSEIARVNVYQALVMGLAAFLVAVPCGIILTYVIVHAINYRSFGWSIDIGLSPWIFSKTLILTAIACLASAIYPTYQLVRSPRQRRLEEE
jgi:putative ABC transport system permease protein